MGDTRTILIQIQKSKPIEIPGSAERKNQEENAKKKRFEELRKINRTDEEMSKTFYVGGVNGFRDYLNHQKLVRDTQQFSVQDDRALNYVPKL